MLSRILQRENFNLLMASGGPEIIQKLSEHVGDIDLLFENRMEFEEGAAFLEKPFTARGLREAVRLVLFGSINP